MGVFTVTKQISVQLNLLYQAGTETQAWVNAVIAAGGTVSQARSTLVDWVIAGLKSDGIWTKLDRLWIFAAENTASALIDLKALASASPVNSPTFNVDGGYTGNGTSSYVNTNYNPATNATNLSQNSASLHFWTATAHAASDTLLDTAVATNTFSSSFAGRSNLASGNYSFELMDATSSNTAGGGPGLFSGVRSSSTAKNIYKNGVDSAGGFSITSVSIPSANIYIGARDTAGAGAQNFTSNQFAAWAVGGSMTATDVANLYYRLNTYMLSIQMDSAAWVAAVVAAGGTVSATRRTLINGLINGLKLDGIWGKLDRLWIHAAENTQSALIDLVNLQTATAVNSPTFTVDGGYTGNGSSSYLNSNYNPSVGGLNYTQNAAHLGCWVASVGETDTTAAVGSLDTSSGNNIIIYWQASTPSWGTALNYSGIMAFNSGGPGCLITTRTSSTSTTSYVNGSAPNTGSGTAGTIPNLPIFIGAKNQTSGGTANYSTHQIAATHAGGALTATDAANFYSRLRGYFDSIQMDSAAWVAAVVAAGGSVSSTRRGLVNDLIRGLKNDGIWIKLDRLWLFAAENSQSALRDIVANAAATTTASPTFTTDRGYQGNGSTSYVDSGFTAPGINHTQNSACLGVWANTVGSAGTSQYHGWVNAGATIGMAIAPHWGTSSVQTSGVANDAVDLNVTNTTGQSFALINRSASNAKQLYNDGNQITSSTTTSVAISGAVSMWFGGRNFGGSTNQMSNEQFSAAVIGGSLTATDVSNLYSRLATYMGAVFANAWATAVVGAGGTVSAARQTLVTQLIQGLMQDGVWSKLDRLWLFAAENSQSALVDLVRGSSATATSSPTFTTDRGYAGNGTSSYVNSNVNLSTATGVNFTQNSASIFAWSNTAGDTGATFNPLVGSGNNVLDLYALNSGVTTWAINASTNVGTTNPYSALGLFTASRTTSTRADIYLNAINLGNSTATSAATSNTNVTMCALPPSTLYGTGQVSAAGFGGALSAGDSTNLYLRLRTYMMAVGIANPGFDSATTSWVSAVTTAGGTVSAARQLLIDNLIQGLKADGVWAKLDRFWIFAAENSQSALVDLVGLTTASGVNSPTFTVDRGYNSNGSTSCINTNFNPATQGTNYTLNAASAGVYDLTARASASLLYMMGARDGSGNLITVTMDANSSVVAALNGSGGASGGGNTSAPTAQGFFVGVRTSSSTLSVYKNGAVVGLVTGATSSSIPSFPVFVCGLNNASALLSPTSDQIAAAFLGGQLTDTDNRNLSKRLSLYMQTVGASVY